MNTMTKLAVSALLGMTLFSSTASADVKKGQKIYLKKLKAPCNIGGATFAQRHTQDEWEAIHEAGKFADEVKKICPKVKKFKPKYTPDVYDFVYEYASDSGNVPAC
ncbi:cytochrome C [Sulfurovum sp.]|uniref:cytochrome C n=1 Tax=Sulfurovum sp. TaxID=1969726 RepID=UPI00356565C8